MHLHKFWPLLPNINFWMGDRAAAYVSTQFWDFFFISYFPKVVTLEPFSNAWSSSYAEFIITDIKFCFTCGELTLHGNTVNAKNIIPLIVRLINTTKNPSFCSYTFLLKLVFTKASLIFVAVIILLRGSICYLYQVYQMSCERAVSRVVLGTCIVTIGIIFPLRDPFYTIRKKTLFFKYFRLPWKSNWRINTKPPSGQYYRVTL